MPLFEYKARNARGESIEGRVEAASADAVASQLLNTDSTPVSISEVAPKREPLEGLKQRIGLNRPTLDDLILFCRQMYSLTKAGVPIIRAVTGLSETSRNVMLQEVLKEIREDLESGRDLSMAMGQHPNIFSQIVVSMVRVGESTGQLDTAFEQLSRYLELERDTRNRIKAALRYPLFVIVAIGVAIGVVNIYVIPAFAKVFKGMNAELPWQTKALIATSDFTVANWHFILLFLVIAVVGIRQYINSEAGRYRWDRTKLRLPAVGSIISRATLARFSRSFAMTTGAGVPLIQALTVVSRAVDNVFVGDRILGMRNGIERGDTLTRTAVATGMFTPLVIQMISVGEETGAVDRMMQEVADFYEREVDYDLKNLSSAIEPILIIAVGILVLILALGVFLPMWNLTQLAG